MSTRPRDLKILYPHSNLLKIENDSENKLEEFIELLTNYAQRRLRILTKGKSRVERQDVDEIAQISVLKAINKFDQFLGKANFSSWFDQICSNTRLNENRRGAQNKLVTGLQSELNIELRNIDMNPSLEARLVMGSNREKSPLSFAIRNEEEGRLHTAIGNLKPKFKEALDIFMNNEPYESAAQKLDVPVGTLKTRIMKAKELILEMMNEPEKSRH